MKNDCIVSIIIPVYNVKPYLVEALESVIRQTYKNLDIIIIEDGSIDGSGSICDEFEKRDKRVRVIHQENKGLSSARNVGLDIMRGEVVAFLDSDDAYHPEYVSAMMDAMIREKADVVLCKCTLHKTTGRLVFTGKEKPEPRAEQGQYDRIEALCALADDIINVGVWNKLYRSNLWKDIRFPDDHVYEDLDTTYRIFDLCGKVFVLNRPLYYHRIRPDSIVTTQSVDNINDMLRAYSHFNSYIATNTPEIFPVEVLKKRCEKYINIMFHYYMYFSRKTEIDFCREIEKRIIEEGYSIDISSCSFRIIIAYWMICHCKILLKLLYLIYRPFRVLTWAIGK